MPGPRDAAAVLNQEFLIIRGKLLELAAAFDRLDAAARIEPESNPNPAHAPAAGTNGTPAPPIAEDPRVARLLEGVKILLEARGDRAKRVQTLFSREYDPDWRTRMEMPARRF